MSDVGRLDVAHSLRQFAELSGAYEPELGEGIVPTLEVGSLVGSPYSLEEPWVASAVFGPAVAEAGFIIITGSAVAAESWITIDRIFIAFASVSARVLIRPYALADIPTLTAGVTTNAATCSRQADSTAVRLLGEVNIRAGTAVAAIQNIGLDVRGLVGTTAMLDCEFHINKLGALVLRTESNNTQIEASFQGRLHISSGT